MVRTRSTSMAKGKAKLCQPPMRASPKLTALRSNTAMQIPTPTPGVPVKEAVTSTLPLKKRQNFRKAGESSSRKDTRIPCRQSRRLAALYSVTKPVSEEKVVIEISDDSVQKEDTNLEQNEALPVAEGGDGEDLPRNDVYDALCAMLDAESGNEAEDIPGQWDLDSVLDNWGRVEQTWALLDLIRDLLQQKSRHDTTLHLHRGPCNFQVWGGRYHGSKRHGNKKGSSFSNSLTYTLSDLRLYRSCFVYTTAWIDEMKGKLRKAGVGWEPRAFLTRYTEIQQAKFGAEMAGESERNERIATKPRKQKLEPMRTHQGSHAYASWPWAARLFGRTDTYAYAFRASMRTHRSIPASINRGAFHHFKESQLPHLA
ncbi:hypothetical protein PIB30_024338 [Stylosanthes scabra]|uniref:Uncharacterized protein n=1 Tax=Stylosanthes scabra TaxID=79078 RepID=A0ABU6Z8R5_9FABA|nr:hypothetical protein [Stylosanthes scabra]